MIFPPFLGTLQKWTGNRAMDQWVVLANSPLLLDFQQLCSCFLCVWLGIIPSCGQLTWADSGGHLYKMKPDISQWLGVTHQLEKIRRSPESLPIPGCKTPVWWKRRVILPFLGSHKGSKWIFTTLWPRQSPSLEIHGQQACGGWCGDLQSPTLSGSSLPANCRWHWHNAEEQPNSTRLSEEHVTVISNSKGRSTVMKSVQGHPVVPKGLMDHHGQLCTVPRSDNLVSFFPGTHMHFLLI